ncbi:MAG: serine protease [Epulopiscium sp.]|nr:serine protease [Candidatus Epulonipiscium sp.]
MHYLAIGILIIGIVLLTIEIFVPGFGIFGILGILAMVAGIVLTAQNLWQGILMFLGMAVFLTTIFTIFMRWVTQKQLYSSLILRDVGQKEKREYDDMDYFIGKIGVAATPLRPSGHVDFNGVRLDVLSSGPFIPPGQKVIVTEVSENKIIVERLEENKQQGNERLQ